jgi:hypothetical protein
VVREFERPGACEGSRAKSTPYNSAKTGGTATP